MTKADYDNQKLFDLRESKKLTQQEVADSVGVSRYTIIRAEKGEMVSWELLKTLSLFYEISISDLLQQKEITV